MSEPFDAVAVSEELDAVKFNALRNSIYHAARREYYDTLNRALNFLVIIFGAGVAGKMSKLFHVEELWLEFGTLIFATAQLTFDFGSKARTHEFLQRKYAEMLAEIELETEANPARWNSKLYTIAGEAARRTVSFQDDVRRAPAKPPAQPVGMAESDMNKSSWQKPAPSAYRRLRRKVSAL